MLPETILRGDEFAATNLSLALRCGGDLAPTNAATGFFGFRDADVSVSPHRELPAELVRELISSEFPCDLKLVDSMGLVSCDRGLRLTADLQVKGGDGRLVHVGDLGPLSRCCRYHDDEPAHLRFRTGTE